MDQGNSLQSGVAQKDPVSDSTLTPPLPAADRAKAAPRVPQVKPLGSYRPYWAKRFGTAKFLPTSREEMAALGWDSCDIVIVTGDAYVDHPSFGMAVIGRMLEAQGFRVGIITQPDWQSADPFKALGKPNLFFGVTAGNMDSMINRYTADRKIRSDDAYTPGDVGGKRPDRASLVYSQRCKEAWSDVPIVMGGIEGSLRRIAHYDYWQDKVRRSILVDAKCDLLLYGNAERAIVEIAHRLAAREPVENIVDVRGTAFIRRDTPEGWFEIDSTSVDAPGRVESHVNPYLNTSEQAKSQGETCAKEDGGAAPSANPAIQPLVFMPNPALMGKLKVPPRDRSVIRLPAYEQVKSDPVLYAHANRVLHLETNPGNARALVQAHGDRDVWINPPPIPLTTAEMDYVFDLHYARSPHPSYADENGSHDHATKIPAWEMIRFCVNIMRGCFGGCTFCSITEHEGRIIQSRSEDSIIQEIEDIRDKVKGFTGTISDLGGPTANMYRLGCKSPEIEAACRKPSCVYPGICSEPGTTDHGPLIKIYRRGPCAQRGEEDPHRLWPALRPGGEVARVHQGAGHPPRGRLPEDRARAHRDRPAVQNDETGHRQLRPLQEAVRRGQPGSRQEAVPHSLLHRCPPGHQRRGHDEPRAVAEEERFPRRPGADLLPQPHGHGHRDVPQQQEPAAQGDARQRDGGHRAR